MYVCTFLAQCRTHSLIAHSTITVCTHKTAASLIYLLRILHNNRQVTHVPHIIGAVVEHLA